MTSLREDLEIVYVGAPEDDPYDPGISDGQEAAYNRLRAFLDDFAKVAELGEKATPGPWRATDGAVFQDTDTLATLSPLVVCKAHLVGPQRTSVRTKKDHAAFIVAARNFFSQWGGK